ncbi:MAG: hypothetical protein A2026_13960 [Deltaproteobacteria bacterium RBG_19FT_COMBO_46_12]|nr:MAG: hypothetical protein A2026_13960 [Deltaproteobacteria bacterium RBG_19FT_COMBO_46_12]
MGVFKRKNKDGEEGETWYVDYRDPTGKGIIKAVGPSKREAEAFARKTSDLLNGSCEVNLLRGNKMETIAKKPQPQPLATA